MAFARLIIDGEDLEFSGDITDKFLGFSNTNSASRSGRIYTDSQPTVKMVEVADIMADPADLERFKAFFESCGEQRFVVTVVVNSNCNDVADGRARYIYTGCVLDGDSPTANLMTKKVSDFAFAYETATPKDL